METPVLELKHITKTFGKITANKDVSLTLNKGEILSILGENGSGKTTLMNAVAGIYAPDEGEVLINGEVVNIKSPKDAYKYGVGMIHQHFKLIDSFSGIDNIILGEKNPFSFKEQYKTYKNKYEEEKTFKTGAKYALNCAGLPFLTIWKWMKFNHLKRNRGQLAEAYAYMYGFDVYFQKLVSDMTVSEKQIVEIVKALYRGANILILDEPTAVLTPQEIKKFFDVLRKMKADGKSIIIITHKLNEVLEISDRIAVLRKGVNVGTIATKDANEKILTEMMVGKKVDLNIERKDPVNPVDRLFINNVTAMSQDGKKILDNVSFNVRSGEILGIAGISGSGQKQLLECIAGLYPYESGDIIFHNPKKDKPASFFHKDLKTIKELCSAGKFHDKNGNKLSFEGLTNKQIRDMVDNGEVLFYEDEVVDLKEKNPLEIRHLGIHLSFVPEDRLGMGLVGGMDMVDNLMLRTYQKNRGTLVDRKKPIAAAEKLIQDLEIVTPGVSTNINKLSGGNIQKVLVGREIIYAPKVFMAAYPVRGLDINSSYLIYNLLEEQKEKGVCVIYVGEDLDVLLALCDRIVVIAGGNVTATLDARTTTKEEVGKYMLGGNE